LRPIKDNPDAHGGRRILQATERTWEGDRVAHWSNPGCVLITGASAGIGAALAREYAAPGRTLVLHGRDAARLATLARECEGRGARVVALELDLREGPAAVDALRQLSAAHVVDLAIVNAGVTSAIGQGEEVEDFARGREVLAVNLDGALATVAGVLPAMRWRGSGQIALMSSLAAYFGLPITPTYCASKAALKAYGEALRVWLAPQGVAVNVVMPGFVQTAMSASLAIPKPFMMGPERAARLIRAGLARNRARIAFPFPFSWGAWWLSVLPPQVSERLVRWLGY
jgi:short-subunit dehydrogenase